MSIPRVPPSPLPFQAYRSGRDARLRIPLLAPLLSLLLLLAPLAPGLALSLNDLPTQPPASRVLDDGDVLSIASRTIDLEPLASQPLLTTCPSLDSSP